jgi:hypothetical protein
LGAKLSLFKTKDRSKFTNDPVENQEGNHSTNKCGDTNLWNFNTAATSHPKLCRKYSADIPNKTLDKSNKLQNRT